MFFALASLWERSPIPVHSVLISKDIFDRYGGFSEDMQANEDRLFFTKIALAGEQFHFTPIVGAFYREHPDSMNRDAHRMLGGHHAFLRIVWEQTSNGQKPRELVRRAVMRSLLHVVDTYGKRGCPWESVEPLLQLYLDVYAFRERPMLCRLVSEKLLRRVWLLKRRARLGL